MKTYLQYLEEKDHRPKMLKFGIPEDVADYLHNLNDKYSIWFANQFKNMPEFQQANDKISWIRTLKDDITSILNWVSTATSIRLPDYDWKSALSAQSIWKADQDIKKSGNFVPEGIPEKCCGGGWHSAPEHYPKFYKSYSNGYYWVDLQTDNCQWEGKAMGHCGKTEVAATIFSLRSEDGAPHVTLAVDVDEGYWCQAKGKQNVAPDSKYDSYIADVLVDLDCYEYRHEYGDDFNAESFRNYIEENPEKFNDPKAVVEKISDDTLELDEFQTVLNEAPPTQFLHVDLEEMYNAERPEVYANTSMYITLKYTDIDPEFDEAGVDRLNVDEVVEGINQIASVYIVDMEIDGAYNDSERFNIRGAIEDAGNMFEMTPDGLEHFTQHMYDIESEDSNISIDEIIAVIKTECESSDIITTHYTTLRNEVFENIENYEGEYTIESTEIVEDYISANFAIKTSIMLPAWQELIKSKAIITDRNFNAGGDSDDEDYIAMLKSTNNPAYYIHKYLHTELKHYKGIYCNFSGINFFFGSDTVESVADEAVMDKQADSINRFIISLDGIVDELNDIIVSEVAPASVNRRPMTYDDIDVKAAHGMYYISYGGEHITTISRPDEPHNIAGIVNRLLARDGMLVYEPHAKEHKGQTKMTFESCYLKAISD